MAQRVAHENKADNKGRSGMGIEWLKLLAGVPMRST
jgi:hypothetical protein